MLVDAGRIYALKVLTGQITPEAIKVGLYTNAVSWSRSTLFSDLAEVGASGYARQTTAGWQVPTIDASGNGDTSASQATFANTSAGAVTAVGFFYLTGTTGVFLGGDAFATPLVIPANIGTLSIFPQLRDNTL